MNSNDVATSKPKAGGNQTKSNPTHITTLPPILTRPEFTTRTYINKLLSLYGIGLIFLLLSAAMLAIAVLTTDWFVLNVNEYIPTSKGGLWTYCYIATTGYLDQYTCLRYEELPNFAVFVNQRLYTARILIICSAGFLALILVNELIGVLILLCARSKSQKFDDLIEQKKNRLRLTSTPTNGNQITNFRFGAVSSPASNSYETGQIVRELERARPTGFASYMSMTLINLVACSMQMILQVAGFALFDAYINQLLSYNTVFLAYRSYSYWMVIASIVVNFIYWVFKIVSTKFVVGLNRQLVGISKSQMEFNAFQSPQYGNNTNYNNISRFSTQNINESFDQNELNKEYLSGQPMNRKSFVFDVANATNSSASNDDGFSDSTFSSIQQYRNYPDYSETETMADRQNTLQQSIYQSTSGDQTTAFVTNPSENNLQDSTFTSIEAPASTMRF